MFGSIGSALRDFLRGSVITTPDNTAFVKQPTLQALSLNDILKLNIPPREMLLDPILPERSLCMLYAPRGVGKTLLALSIGLAIASGT